MEVWQEKFNESLKENPTWGSDDAEVFEAGFKAAITAVLDSFHWHMHHGRVLQFDDADIRDPRIPRG